MDINGSPEPTFDTNKDCTYFLTTIPARIEIEGAVEGAVEGATKGTKSKIVILLKAIINRENERVPYYVKVTGLPAKTIERYMKLLTHCQQAGYFNFTNSIFGYYSGLIGIGGAVLLIRRKRN